MKAFVVSLSFPIFSLKLPLAFQVADTSLLPSPSSLRGALARALAYFHTFSSNDFQEAYLLNGVLKTIRELLDLTLVLGSFPT